MDERAVDAALAAVERELDAHRVPDLRALRFWRAVNAVKRDPRLVERFAGRVGEIDREAFRRRVRLHFPAAVGIVLLTVGSLFGLVLLWLAATVMHPVREVMVLVGMGALLVCTHNLGHYAYGSLVGVRFTDWFIDLPRRPQPGLKVDYASYLRAPAASRAWMHASGAIVTKIVPFAVLPYAIAIGSAAWAIAALVAAGIIGILTDLLFSVHASDWKKFRREITLSRASRTTP